ncbi:MAG TPA: ankyrin repeat domain-containing protein [Gammaproteobacteria bacterium]|nr:ankyrin repeat domain-containing protein [Gammaproteobacteria bacterium]
MDKFVKRSFDFDELILLIKENKVHIDTFDGVNKTLLMLAANLGNDAIVQELIKFGAKIDLRNNECHTALMQATQGNCSNENEYSLISASPKSSINNVCKILIAQGADVNTKDQYGDSVLMHACHKGLGDHVDLLLAHGADVNYENNNNTSLIFAARGGFDQIILKLLDKGANMHHKNALGCTALSEAAANGFEGTVNILKQRGADINSQDNDGNTPLLRSIEGGYKCVINTLLTSNADVHIKNNSGDTVLMASIRQRINETLIEQILEKKPDLDAKARNNNTALGYAIDTKNEKLALTLIALGACPNVKHNGYPLLVKAIKNNLNCVIEKLIGKVDLNAKVIIDNVYLNNSRSNDDNALLSAVASKNILLVEKLVKFGADINAVGYLGRSALMDAIASYNTEMALFLISLGSNLEVKDKNGRTALDYAARYGDENVKDKINEINAQSEEKRNLLKIRMR